MNSKGILFLTVSGKGKIRSWDSTIESMTNRAPDEVCVQISLTQPQIVLLLRAERAAGPSQNSEPTTSTNPTYERYLNDVSDPRD